MTTVGRRSEVFVVLSAQSVELIQLTSLKQLLHGQHGVISTETCCRRNVRHSGRIKLILNVGLLGYCGAPSIR
jgi:hypothetical protein